MLSEYDVLIIDDDPVTCELLRYIFSSNNYNIQTASDGIKGLGIIRHSSPDIIILDLGLPDIEGLKLLRIIREKTDNPVLVVSARTSDSDKVTAFENGADDYITKPFSSAELIARVRNALRHTKNYSENSKTKFSIGEMSVDYCKKQVFVCGKMIHLTKNEFKILALLSENAGKILTYETIIKKIWGVNPGGDTRILRVNITNIRKKIESDTANPEYIITEPGIGYKMPV